VIQCLFALACCGETRVKARCRDGGCPREHWGLPASGNRNRKEHILVGGGAGAARITAVIFHFVEGESGGGSRFGLYPACKVVVKLEGFLGG